MTARAATKVWGPFAGDNLWSTFRVMAALQTRANITVFVFIHHHGNIWSLCTTDSSLHNGCLSTLLRASLASLSVHAVPQWKAGALKTKQNPTLAPLQKHLTGYPGRETWNPHLPSALPSTGGDGPEQPGLPRHPMRGTHPLPWKLGSALPSTQAESPAVQLGYFTPWPSADAQHKYWERDSLPWR